MVNPNINFNSIKVQLEQQLLLHWHQLLVFQFHKGTIRTDYFNGVLPTAQLFQFHKGTIRTDATNQLATIIFISIP